MVFVSGQTMMQHMVQLPVINQKILITVHERRLIFATSVISPSPVQEI